VDPSANEIVWTYETRPGWNFFSFFISGAQRLPNGNTLICEGMTGRLFEVTYEGEIVWEYVSPFYGEHERFGRSNTIFRAYRYGPDFAGFSEKDLDPREICLAEPPDGGLIQRARDSWRSSLPST
jgi:hypothetical protein